MDLKNVINLNDLEYKANQIGENYKYESAPLAQKMGAKKLGFHAEILPPKQFSCPYHFHHSEEEVFLILEGKAMLRQADNFREVAEGDLIFFKKCPEGAHQFYNHTNSSFKFSALSTMDDYEIWEYSDSNKINIVKIKKIFQAGSEADYLKDEEDPKSHCPKELH